MNAVNWNSDLSQVENCKSIFVIIPAFNEGVVIQDVLNELLQKLPATGLNCQIVVVDDGSRDETYENAAQLVSAAASPRDRVQASYTVSPAIHVLRHIVNLGQGAALATGIQYALAQGAQVLVTYDADGQHVPEDLSALVAPVAAGTVDIALGSRFLSGAVNVPRGRRMLLKGAIFFTGLTEGIWLTDAHNGLRALSADAARKIEITQNRMAHASEIIREIARLKLRYVEVPMNVRYTDYSRMKGQRATDALNILIELLEDLLP